MFRVNWNSWERKLYEINIFIGDHTFHNCSGVDVYLSNPLYTTAYNTGSVGVGPKTIWKGTNII
jgi:hypothetical protein